MNIAIVGNSPILLNNEYGQEIDSHEMVIRFNNFVTNGYERHTGKKTTDICFNPQTTRNDEILKLPKEHRLFFYTKNTREELEKRFDEVYGNEMSLDDVTIIDNEKYYYELKEKLKTNNNWHASSGLIICQMMVDMYPDSVIDVYGITFFKDAIKKEGDKYSTIHHVDGTTANCGHDHQAELNYYETYLKDKINLHL